MTTVAPYAAGLASTVGAPFLTGSELWYGIFLTFAVGASLGLVVALIDLATARTSD